MSAPGPLILNVDDYQPGRYARTKLLRQRGFLVIEAASGRETLDLVSHHHPPLVLLDVNLPDMSGIEVCRKIKENQETSTTTVLHISASSILTQHQVLGLNSGADGYIVEPVEPTVLIATVNAFLRARRAEDALLKTTEELRWFSYRVAHDLREPLRTLTVYSEMLKAKADCFEDPETGRSIGFIADAADKMRSFIDGLLDYSQTAGGKVEFHDIECGAMVGRAVASLEASIKESSAKVTCGPLPVVKGDPRLEYVFQNLISNAIKYRRQDVTPEIRITAREADRDWLFSVRDNGIGIAPRYIDTVFEIFRRLHGSDVPGNGIGLALSRKIVEAHGGKIWIESEPGLGTTVSFLLPIHPG